MGRLGQGDTVVKPDPGPIGTPNPRFDEFIKAEQSGMGLSDLFGAKPLAIKGPVGPFGPNRRADVGKVETFLSRTGNHDLDPTDGPTGYYGSRLEDAINAFQRNNKLKPDGLVKPFGETIRTPAGKLKDQIKPPTSLAPQPKPAAPLILPGRGAEQGNAPLKHPGGKLPDIAAAASPAKDPLEAFRKADRESKKALEASQKPKPTHRDAELTGMETLAASPRPNSPEIQTKTEEIVKKTPEFLRLAKLADGLSPFVQSSPIGPLTPRISAGETIKAMEYFLAGKGGVKNYDPKWMLQNPRLRAAAKRNETNFEKWMTGKNEGLEERERIDRVLLGIKDGQTVRENTPFQGEYRFDKVKDRFSDQRLLLVNGHVFSKGRFIFSRKGNIVTVIGVVEQKISDPFDWKKGSVRSFGFGLEIRHDDMLWLQKHAKAKPFEVRSVWRRKLSWKLRIVRDPNAGARRIVGVGKPQWSDAK